jgi:hypothetical protein
LFRTAKAVGIAGLHEFRPVNEWLQAHMKEFVHDEVLSKGAMEAGLFDRPVLERLLADYFGTSGRGFRETVLALDLALAAKNFRATA